ncbi:MULTISPECIES: LCP family protein [Kitasatospora]|uniref:Putative lytR family regulatory protein n=1 Tax=Kitasatospora setae (strain ATCC 33774 / DSM 43861 / JCM 3304 / KCC A-0304 / NBRC 14216 / KM-6054) TaxID=452652 RepID=E4N4K6_KITSK|nr:MULTISPECIES: LCP family protein [Kitasatospora]BAJ26137.1 putative lytR family regulatory protein [Kitasatospora setae KM-6054]
MVQTDELSTGETSAAAAKDAAAPAKPRRRARRILLITGGTVLALVLAAGGTGFWMYRHLEGNLDTVDIDKALGEDRPAPLPDGAQDILVLGSDSRSGDNGDLAGGDVGGTARSDTAMVVHIPEGRSNATVVSIPRDTMVARPACTTADGKQVAGTPRVMFNSIYTTAGPACVVKTVESMTGLRMNHYVEIDFAGFKDLVDAMGGVEVTTDTAIDDKYSGLHLPAGTHLLDGTQALAFVRTRHGVGDGSDLGRIGLQQKFLLSVLSQLQRKGTLTSPTKAYGVANAATKALTTDTSLGSLNGLLDFAQSMKGLQPERMKTVMLPVVTDRIDHNRVVADEAKAAALWASLRENRPVPSGSPAASASASPSASARSSASASAHN